MNTHAQIGLEYLVFTSFLLLVAVILFAYSFTTYSTSLQLVQTQGAVDAVASAVDFVYAKGPGNTVVVNVKLPAGLTEFRVDQNVVRATLNQVGGNSTLFSFTKSKITPRFLFFQEGLYFVRVSMGDVNVDVSNV